MHAGGSGPGIQAASDFLCGREHKKGDSVQIIIARWTHTMVNPKDEPASSSSRLSMVAITCIQPFLALLCPVNQRRLPLLCCTESSLMSLHHSHEPYISTHSHCMCLTRQAAHQNQISFTLHVLLWMRTPQLATLCRNSLPERSTRQSDNQPIDRLPINHIDQSANERSMRATGTAKIS